MPSQFEARLEVRFPTPKARGWCARAHPRRARPRGTIVVLVAGASPIDACRRWPTGASTDPSPRGSSSRHWPGVPRRPSPVPNRTAHRRRSPGRARAPRCRGLQVHDRRQHPGYRRRRSEPRSLQRTRPPRPSRRRSPDRNQPRGPRQPRHRSPFRRCRPAGSSPRQTSGTSASTACRWRTARRR